MNGVEELEINSWSGPFSAADVARAADALEAGNVLYAPRLPFELSDAERRFLTPDCLDGKSKNVSYRPQSGALGGTRYEGADREQLHSMLKRYHDSSRSLLNALCPAYAGALKSGFTSYRPAEVAGRASSWRRDDTRLHVDAFPSRPLQGLRILRVFTNVNPRAPRIWRVGEPFEQAAARFAPQIRPPLPGLSWLFQTLRIVKGKRTEYDHFMLGIHDRMKADQGYQSGVAQTELALQPGATWACYTDSVSHAAMAGQFAFEQTFYLPVGVMLHPERSPLRVLERLTGRSLIEA
jgi:3-deoxy-D-manno-oct-2-ulosonic acid (Kdo) hydroxylase